MEMDSGDAKGKKGKNDKMREAVQTLVNHRAVYLPMYRGNVPEALAVFDMADPSLIVGKREVTTVATQALFLMNSPFVLKQSAEMARRLLEQKEMQDPARVELAYRLTLGRRPSPSEAERIQKFLNDFRRTAGDKDRGRIGAWMSVCQTLFASAEFRYLY
jgi:hypothetical protein